MSKKTRAVRVRMVMLIARVLGVPVDVHQAFFMKGMRSKISLS
jgi:hypothetical protein